MDWADNIQLFEQPSHRAHTPAALPSRHVVARNTRMACSAATRLVISTTASISERHTVEAAADSLRRNREPRQSALHRDHTGPGDRPSGITIQFGKLGAKPP